MWAKTAEIINGTGTSHVQLENFIFELCFSVLLIDVSLAGRRLGDDRTSAGAPSQITAGAGWFRDIAAGRLGSVRHFAAFQARSTIQALRALQTLGAKSLGELTVHELEMLLWLCGRQSVSTPFLMSVMPLRGRRAGS